MLKRSVERRGLARSQSGRGSEDGGGYCEPGYRVVGGSATSRGQQSGPGVLEPGVLSLRWAEGLGL